jgi:hypothetical protein
MTPDSWLGQCDINYHLASLCIIRPPLLTDDNNPPLL